jgi:hypothetical protein
MKTIAPKMSARGYHDMITRRAREIWRARHRPVGKDMEIWLEAERELLAQQLIPASPPSTPRTSSARVAADEIDEDKMLRRLDTFGESPARSVTALG